MADRKPPYIALVLFASVLFLFGIGGALTILSGNVIYSDTDTLLLSPSNQTTAGLSISNSTTTLILSQTGFSSALLSGTWNISGYPYIWQVDAWIQGNKTGGDFVTSGQLQGNLSGYQLVGDYVTGTQLTGNLSVFAVSPSQLAGNLTGYPLTSEVDNWINGNDSALAGDFLNLLSESYVSNSQLSGNLSSYPTTASVSSWIQGNSTNPTFKGSSVQIAGNASYGTIFAIPLTASKINLVEIKVIANTSATGNGVRLRATVNDNANTGSCTFSSPSGATAQTFDTISLTTTAGNTGETASALANLPMVFEINCAVLATTGTNTLTINVTNELTTGTTNIYPESYYIVRVV